MPKNKREVR